MGLFLRVLRVFFLFALVLGVTRTASGAWPSAPTGYQPTFDFSKRKCWYVKDHDWAFEHTGDDRPFNNAAAATLWGGAKFNHHMFPTRGRHGLVEMSSRYFNKSITTRLHTYTENGETQKRPLVVYLSGLFSDSRDGASKRYFSYLRDWTYHVLVIPNGWSIDYQMAEPGHHPGEYDHEARAAITLIENAIRQIGAHNISTVRLVGDSYGGFLAAVLATIDYEESQLIDGDVTIIGPYFHANRAIVNLDMMMHRTERRLEGCLPHARKIKFGFDLKFASDQSDLSDETMRCSEPFLAHLYFGRSLIRLENFLIDPAASIEAEDEIEWRSGVRFYTVASEHDLASQRIFRNPDQVWLPYWLDRMGERANTVKILSTEDDFLNNPVDWEDNPYFEFDGCNLILMEWGGHMGFRGDSGFRGLLHRQFPYPFHSR